MDSIAKPLSSESEGPSVSATRKPTRAEAEAAVRTLIAWTGDNPERNGLIDTPARVVRALDEFYEGYAKDPAAVLSRTFDEIGHYDDMVLVKDIPFHSHCEHHMVPFFGKAHIAYFPSESVVGLSKLARLVDIYAHRLQSQERLTGEVIAALEEHLKPRGCAVMIEAEHQCLTMRGAQKPGSTTVTTLFSGVFRDDPAEQTRFLTLVNRAG